MLRTRGIWILLVVAGTLPAQVTLKPVDSYTRLKLLDQKETRINKLRYIIQKYLSSHGKSLDTHSLKIHSADVDQFGRTVANYDQYWNGIKISGSNIIAIMDKDDNLVNIREAYSFLSEPSLYFSKPKYSKEYADTVARKALKDKFNYSKESIIPGWQELVIEPQITRVPLPWPSLWSTETGAGDPTHSVRVIYGWKLVHHRHYLTNFGKNAHVVRVDALTGEMISAESSHASSPATLTAVSQYYRNDSSNLVPFQGSSTGSSYILANSSLFGVHPGSKYNPVYSSLDSVFGDGQEFTLGNPPEGANGQTQAADIIIGLNKVYNFYLTLFGRYHIDGNNGYYVPATAHNEECSAGAAASWHRDIWGSESYWIDFRSQENLDLGGPTELSVVAHEWTHLVNFRAARVGRETSDSFGARAVNEAISTVMSTACRLWDSTGGGGGIAYPDPARWKYDWSYQPQIHNSLPGQSGNINATEVLFRPSYTNIWEPSWWTSDGIGINGIVHRAGAPLHRAFYFLANGAQPIRNVNDISDEERGRTTPFLPWGFDGIGPHNATLVFYQALTQTMHQNTDILHSPLDLIEAGNQLFGSGSESVKIIRKALAAVNLITPDIYYLPSNYSYNTLSSPEILPDGESLFEHSGMIDPGDAHYYVQMSIPPYSTLILSVDSSIPSSAPRQQGLGIEILTSNGNTILAYANPIINLPVVRPPIRYPTVDPMPDPPPEITGRSTRSTIRYKNDSSETQPIYIRLKSEQNRTESSSYVCSGVVQYREAVEQSSAAIVW